MCLFPLGIPSGIEAKKIVCLSYKMERKHAIIRNCLHSMLRQLHVKVALLNCLLLLGSQLWNTFMINWHFSSTYFIGKVSSSEYPESNIFTHLGKLLCTFIRSAIFSETYRSRRKWNGKCLLSNVNILKCIFCPKSKIEEKIRYLLKTTFVELNFGLFAMASSVK
jgi:hypothetical protein